MALRYWLWIASLISRMETSSWSSIQLLRLISAVMRATMRRIWRSLISKSRPALVLPGRLCSVAFCNCTRYLMCSSYLSKLQVNKSIVLWYSWWQRVLEAQMAEFYLQTRNFKRCLILPYRESATWLSRCGQVRCSDVSSIRSDGVVSFPLMNAIRWVMSSRSITIKNASLCATSRLPLHGPVDSYLYHGGLATTVTNWSMLDANDHHPTGDYVTTSLTLSHPKKVSSNAHPYGQNHVYSMWHHYLAKPPPWWPTIMTSHHDDTLHDAGKKSYNKLIWSLNAHSLMMFAFWYLTEFMIPCQSAVFISL